MVLARTSLLTALPTAFIKSRAKLPSSEPLEEAGRSLYTELRLKETSISLFLFCVDFIASENDLPIDRMTPNSPGQKLGQLKQPRTSENLGMRVRIIWR